MKYTLYYAPGAASFAVHWLLVELGAEYEAVRLDLERRDQKGSHYLRLNPAGKVPTLVIDDHPYAEAAALLLMIAEDHPDRALVPQPGSPERFPFLQLYFFLANTLQPAFRAWFYPHEPAGPEQAEAVMANARSQIEAAWERIDALLAGRAGFLFGAEPGVADYLLAMLMRWSRNMPKPAAAWPNISAYLRRIAGIPSLAEVHAREEMPFWPEAAALGEA
jgi:glutathione S-transferase